MRLLSSLILSASLVACQNVAGKSFAGSNNYFLHAIDVGEQEQYIKSLSEWGASVLRLWVTGGTGSCEKGSLTTKLPQYEEEIGTYKTEVLEALDVTLSLLKKYGLKAIISPHDAGKLNANNGCDAYCAKYKTSDGFYNSDEAAAHYDARLTSILNHKSAKFGGKAWKDLSEVIFAFDIQNEPMIASESLLRSNDPKKWLANRASVLRSTLGSASPIKIATGGIGGSQYCCDHEYNVISAALDAKDIDIVSVHGYMNKTTDWGYFVPKLVQQADAKGKKLMIEEWGVSTSYHDNFDTQVKLFNENGVPWLYWQVIPGYDKTQSDSCTGSCCNIENPAFDGFEIGLSSSKGDIKSALQAANSADALQDWTGYL